MMEFEDQTGEHEEEEEAVEAEEDEDEEDTELFSHSHPSSYDDSVTRVDPVSPSPQPLKMSTTTTTETPPQPVAFKNQYHNRHSSSAARYRECLKNHAIGIGGHAVDGCGEFMPAGPEGTLDALKCAACNCHRNFHRKEFMDPTPDQITALYPHHPHLHPPPHHLHHHLPPHHPPPQVFQFYPYNRTTGPGGGYLQLAPPQRPPPPQPLALPSTSGEAEDAAAGGMIGIMTSPASAGMAASKKRFRTKFTAEQKERMLELAERMGWRLQKQDEALVQRFCEENGVKRHVLKVWMHNNKHTLGGGSGGSGSGAGGSSGGK